MWWRRLPAAPIFLGSSHESKGLPGNAGSSVSVLSCPKRRARTLAGSSGFGTDRYSILDAQSAFPYSGAVAGVAAAILGVLVAEHGWPGLPAIFVALTAGRCHGLAARHNRRVGASAIVHRYTSGIARLAGCAAHFTGLDG